MVNKIFSFLSPVCLGLCEWMNRQASNICHCLVQMWRIERRQGLVPNTVLPSVTPSHWPSHHHEIFFTGVSIILSFVILYLIMITRNWQHFSLPAKNMYSSRGNLHLSLAHITIILKHQRCRVEISLSWLLDIYIQANSYTGYSFCQSLLTSNT